MNTNIYLVLYDLTTGKTFTKYFESEFKKDKFKTKLKYSKKLKVLKDSSEDYFLN